MVKRIVRHESAFLNVQDQPRMGHTLYSLLFGSGYSHAYMFLIFLPMLLLIKIAHDDYYGSIVVVAGYDVIVNAG